MKKSFVVFAVLAALLMVSPLFATPVEVEVVFSNTPNPGANGVWQINYTSGVQDLTFVTINLSSSYFFDSALPATSGGYMDYNVMNDPNSVGDTPSATGGSLDGTNTITVSFSSFSVGDTFTFGVDIDRVASTTGVYPNDLVGAAEVVFGFGHVPGWTNPAPTPTSAGFATTSPTATTGTAHYSGDTVSSIPEPGTYALFGSGLLLLGLLRRARKN